jgi:hypothetical protein
MIALDQIDQLEAQLDQQTSDFQGLESRLSQSEEATDFYKHKYEEMQNICDSCHA